MNDMKHATIIREEVYTDKLKRVIVRTQQKIISNDSTLLTDYLKCLASLTDHTTDELEVKVKRSRDGSIRITKTWAITNEQP